MKIKDRILSYLGTYGKENKYKLARALKMSVHEVAKILNALEEEGKIEIKTGKAGIKGKTTVSKLKTEIIEKSVEEEKSAEDELFGEEEKEIKEHPEEEISEKTSKEELTESKEYFGENEEITEKSEKTD